MWSVATFICTEVAEKEDALVCGRRRPTLAGHQAQLFVATGCALVRNVAAMGPPGDGRNSVSARYVRHFNIIYIEPYSEDSLQAIFSTIMDWMFAAKNNPPFPATC